jgi:hypothetical protein
VCDPQNDSKPAAQFPYSSFSETARVDHFAPMATHNLVAERARRQQQNVAKQDYAATDPSYETKPAFKSPRRNPPTLSPASIRDVTPSFSGTGLVAHSARKQQQQQQQQQNVATHAYATAEPSYDLKPAFLSSRPSTCSSLTTSWSAAGASLRPAALHNHPPERAGFAGHAQQEFERALCDRDATQAFQQVLLAEELKKEIKCNGDLLRQEQNQRQRDILRQNEMFQQRSQALRDDMLRQVNQILEADISRQNQLLRDGEVRHQNQLSRERELERENQLLRESVIASKRRTKSAENAQRQVASVSQALHQLHQEEQQVLHEQQHQQQQRMHRQQQGEQHQQEKQQQKQVQQQQLRQNRQLVDQDQQNHHQQQQYQQQQHQQQLQAQQQQQHHHLSNIVSWLQGQVQAGHQGQPGPNQNGDSSSNSSPNSSSNNNNSNNNKRKSRG